MLFGHYPKKEEERQELINNLARRGMICVTAAGNSGPFGGKVASPACLSNVLAVGALDRRGRPADYNHPGKIDVYAPGEKLMFVTHLLIITKSIIRVMEHPVLPQQLGQ